LIDPEILDKIVDYYLAHDYDYVSNTIKPTMPDGLDIEVINYKSLQRAWKEARKLSEREHVTLYIYNHPELFKLFNYEHEPDLSGMRWVVDQEEDYKFITEVYNVLYSHDKLFYTKDVLSLLAKHPGLSDLNNSIKRNEGLLKSLREDASE
jgi:spore coat polysaccharide biosynthesis protein SpsF (cytidylyltransferase family)